MTLKCRHPESNREPPNLEASVYPLSYEGPWLLGLDYDDCDVTRLDRLEYVNVVPYPFQPGSSFDVEHESASNSIAEHRMAELQIRGTPRSARLNTKAGRRADL